MTTPHSLAGALRASREHLTRITAGLDGDRLLGPKLAIVNPPLWELGHVAWFQEYWCLRRSARGGMPDSILPGADALYDSAKVAHDTRWNLPLPDLIATRSYQAEILERVTHRIEREPENRELHYFVQLATFHEDMHAEAFHYTRQTLGYEDPFEDNGSAPRPGKSLRAPDKLNSPPARGGVPAQAGGVVGAAARHVTTPSASHPPLLEKEGRETRPVNLSGAPGEDAELAGGTFMLGAPRGSDFVFDNEKWAHEVQLQPFRIARAPVTNAEYAAFVEVGGYSRREWWSEDGWAWRSGENLQVPKYWVKQGGTWAQRRFDRVMPLQPNEPVVHVSWHEAQAYCRFANRRLPTEAEWEFAVSWDTGAGKKRRYPWGNLLPDAAHANLEGTRVAVVEAYPSGDAASGCRQMLGNVWEWTATTFAPYPGFVVDPYQEYSEPWFGTHKVLRGGSFATPRRLIRNTWRNFYTPDRYDVFAGFRTCAVA